MAYQIPEVGADQKVPTPRVVKGSTMGGLIGYLNDAEKVRGNAIIKILNLMLERHSVDGPAWGTTEKERDVTPLYLWHRGKWVPNPRLKRVAPKKYEEELEIANKEFLLGRELEKYRFIPQPYRLGRRGFLLHWQVSKKGQPALPRAEANVLELIVSLAGKQSLTRLRRCVHCQKWLYAHVIHRKYCSTKCQQLEHHSTEHWKEHRRNYMRNYRQVNFPALRPRRTRVKST
jgi:hypothetical protein